MPSGKHNDLMMTSSLSWHLTNTNSHLQIVSYQIIADKQEYLSLNQTAGFPISYFVITVATTITNTITVYISHLGINLSLSLSLSLCVCVCVCVCVFVCVRISL